MNFCLLNNLFFRKIKDDRYNEMMMKNAQMMSRLRDPYYSNTRAWEEQDRMARQKMAELEKSLPYGDK